MADVALGAVGVVPVLGFTIASVQAVKSRLDGYRHSSRFLQRTQKRLKYQSISFDNECRLLLRDCLNNNVSLNEAPLCSRLESETSMRTDIDVSKSTRANYDQCRDLVDEIRKDFQKLESDLKRHQINNPESTFQRMREGIDISYRKEQYQARLEELSADIANLRSLREQMVALQEPRQPGSTISPTKEAVICGAIRRACKALYEDLNDAWPCSRHGLYSHTVKLFLEVDMIEDDVRMDIVILCGGSDRYGADTDVIQHLSGSSRFVRKSPSQSPSLTISRSVNCQTESPGWSFRSAEQGLKSIVGQDDGNGRLNNQSSAAGPTDLGISDDVCAKLAAKMGKVAIRTEPQCVGYIDARPGDRYRHMAFLPGDSPDNEIIHHTFSRNDELSGLDDLQDTASSHSLSTVDKLRLARVLVSAVLKFAATPWLADKWGLEDIAILQSDSSFAKRLKTLHLNAELGRENTGLVNSNLAADPSLTSQMSGDYGQFVGVTNVSLHCLAVTLLQIDQEKKINPSEVQVVRKLANIGSRLGPRYQEITRRCLQCDFGHGNDLDKADLRNAVHKLVIKSLVSMISALGD